MNVRGESSDERSSKHGWLRSPFLLLILGLMIVVGGVVGVFAATASSSKSAQVMINANSSLGLVPSTAFGMNTATWDTNLTSATVPYLQNMGVKLLRYPGGSTSDTYNWETNTVYPSGSGAGTVPFSSFMQIAQQTGAQPIITVNYGSGTPALAAAWVQNANITHKYGIKYWEIGNEVYGNGTYGSGSADWEYDTHSQKGATAYAKNALQYITVMKAVDPTIKVGVVLTSPGDWPDGQVATSDGDTMDWNHTVLSLLGSEIDFVSVHWYTDSNTDASNVSDAGLLSDPPAHVASKMQTLRSLINQYAGSNASNIQVQITETNSVPYNVGKQTVSLVNALFLDEDYMDWLQNGAASVVWWDLYNGTVTNGDNSSSLYGTANYGDYGVLSSGGSSGGVREPAVNTPFPAYYGYQMLTKFVAPGDTMISASSNQSLVAAYAVKHSGGKITVLLINKDPSNSYNVSFSYNGFTPSSTATSYFYGEGSTAITSQNLSGFSTGALPPYSLTVYSIPAAFTSASQSTPTPTATSAAMPTPTTTFAATPMPTATTTAGLGCSVTSTVSSQWSGGFMENITLSNTGSTAIKGWTLQFSLPNGQKITSSWNGNFTQQGSIVTVTNVWYSATLAAGSPLSLGFVVSSSGGTITPTSFTLNGTACK